MVNIGYEINRSLALKEKLIEENKKLELNDDCAQERIWQEMYDILSINLN